MPRLGVTAIVFQGFRTFGRGSSRAQRIIRPHAETVNLLPESPARARLLAHLDDTVSRMIEVETEFRRDVVGIFTGVGLLGFAIIIGLRLNLSFGEEPSVAWAVATALMTVLLLGAVAFGAYNLRLAWPKVRRDSSGKRIYRPSAPTEPTAPAQRTESADLR